MNGPTFGHSAIWPYNRLLHRVIDPYSAVAPLNITSLYLDRPQFGQSAVEQRTSTLIDPPYAAMIWLLNIINVHTHTHTHTHTHGHGAIGQISGIRINTVPSGRFLGFGYRFFWVMQRVPKNRLSIDHPESNIFKNRHFSQGYWAASTYYFLQSAPRAA